MRMLRSGFCLELPARNENGLWQVIMVRQVAGQRQAGAVTVIVQREPVLVVRTVEWIDTK